MTLWTVTVGSQRHELAAGDARGAAHVYGWTCIAPGESERVVIERGDARSVWRVERRVQSVKVKEMCNE